MTATIPIVCVSHAESIVTLLHRKEALRQQRPLPISLSIQARALDGLKELSDKKPDDVQVARLVSLLDELRQTNQDIVKWLVRHIPAELLAQAAETAAGGGR